MVVFHFYTKGGKVGENWNKVARCGYPPAVASTHKNELMKIHLKWWISSQSAFLGYFYLRLEIARALLDMKSVLLPPPPLSTSTPGCRFRFPNFTQAVLVARFCDARAVSAAQNKRFHGPNWAAVHPGRTELRQVTNIPQVKENASSCMGIKGQFWWFWLHFKDTPFHLNMIQRAVMCRWNHHPLQNKERSAAARDTWWRPRRWRSQSGRWWASHSLCCGGRGEGSWERGWSLKIQSHSHHKELGREREKRQIE